MTMQTTFKQPTRLERLIAHILWLSLSSDCGNCGAEIVYEKYADPVSGIAEAVREWILSEFNKWADEAIENSRCCIGRLGISKEADKRLENDIKQLEWAKKNLERILKED